MQKCLLRIVRVSCKPLGGDKSTCVTLVDHNSAFLLDTKMQQSVLGLVIFRGRLQSEVVQNAGDLSTLVDDNGPILLQWCLLFEVRSCFFCKLATRKFSMRRILASLLFTFVRFFCKSGFRIFRVGNSGAPGLMIDQHEVTKLKSA
jgi:hypothetical protein